VGEPAASRSPRPFRQRVLGHALQSRAVFFQRRSVIPFHVGFCYKQVAILL
jgi:hypothetical protein